MKFDYEEIGTFNAVKAAEGLVELAMKIKNEVSKENQESE